MTTKPPRNGQLGTSINFQSLDAQLHPKPLYRANAVGGTATRGVATSSSALTAAFKGEELALVGKGGECGGRQDKISSVKVSLMVTVPLTNESILTYGAELERWNANNKQRFSVLIIYFKGAANSFLIRFAGRPDSRQQLKGQAAWKAIAEK